MEDKKLEREMLAALSKLERQNDAVGHTRTRHKISEHIVELRRLVRSSPSDLYALSDNPCCEVAKP